MENFSYYRPATESDLKKTVESSIKFHFYAGGTDLLVKIRHNTVKPELLIDLKGIKNYSLIKKQGKSLFIGACATLSAIAEHPAIEKNYPALMQACLSVGSVQVRNRATLAGNLCNASPAADTLPALLIFNAEVIIDSPSGTKQVSVSEFTKSPGKTILKSDEWVSGILLPAQGKLKSSFLKNSRRKALDLSTVCIAAATDGKKDFRASVGACAPVTMRAEKSEKFLSDNGASPENIHQASLLLPLNPISDLRGSKDHRETIARSLFVKIITSLMEA